MNRMGRQKLAMAALVCLAAAARMVAAEAPVRYAGMADASAAAPVGQGQMIAASDEDNVLRLYGLGRPELVAEYRWDRHLALGDTDEPEVDIEGAARVGDVIYWIGSHGRNRNGRWRPSRHRFFATRVTEVDGRVTLDPEGQVRSDLVTALTGDPAFAACGLREALGDTGQDDERLAPKRQGLNIEGLAWSPLHGTNALVIGFRNPVPDGRALVVPLLNAQAVVLEGAKPVFGGVHLLELGGLGIRDMVYWEARGVLAILAGAAEEGGSMHLYIWSGRAGERAELASAELQAGLRGLHAEVVMAAGPHLIVLSDDGRKDLGKGGAAGGFRGLRLAGVEAGARP